MWRILDFLLYTTNGYASNDIDNDTYTEGLANPTNEYSYSTGAFIVTIYGQNSIVTQNKSVQEPYMQ